jgi:hypothetical protein
VLYVYQFVVEFSSALFHNHTRFTPHVGSGETIILPWSNAYLSYEATNGYTRFWGRRFLSQVANLCRWDVKRSLACHVLGMAWNCNHIEYLVLMTLAGNGPLIKQQTRDAMQLLAEVFQDQILSIVYTRARWLQSSM